MPAAIDAEVASLTLASLGTQIDILTPQAQVPGVLAARVVTGGRLARDGMRTAT